MRACHVPGATLVGDFEAGQLVPVHDEPLVLVVEGDLDPVARLFEAGEQRARHGRDRSSMDLTEGPVGQAVAHRELVPGVDVDGVAAADRDCHARWGSVSERRSASRTVGQSASERPSA